MVKNFLLEFNQKVSSKIKERDLKGFFNVMDALDLAIEEVELERIQNLKKKYEKIYTENSSIRLRSNGFTDRLSLCKCGMRGPFIRYCT